jgi:hypothetical protein
VSRAHRFLLELRAAFAVPRLDTTGSSRLNSKVQEARSSQVVRAVALVAGLLVAATAFGRPRVQVAPFTVAKSDDGLAYFGPEVARAVAAALAAAGVDAGPGAELTVVGRIEELSGERVRLVAAVRGRSLSTEGPVDTIDALAAQLGGRLAPLVIEGEAASGRARPAERKVEAAKSEPTKSEPTKSEPTKSEPAKSEPAKSEPAKGETTKNETVARADTAAAAESAPAATAPAATEPARPTVTQPLEPYPPSYPYGGFVRGRVVAHAIADIPTAYAGAGAAATQALYGFLSRRLRLSLVPTGVGMTSLQVATDESWRSLARAVVMARLDGVQYLNGPLGLSVRVRLEVAVVRDGRLVFRRAVDSTPSDPARRGRDGDPVYQAVGQALELLVPELASVLVEIR